MSATQLTWIRRSLAGRGLGDSVAVRRLEPILLVLGARPSDQGNG